MEQFVTDDWMLVDRPGIIPKDAFHGVVASGDLDSGSFQGEPMSADEWTSDVLVRTADGWKCVLTQLTPR